jgi:mannose-6-phosphate isomerase-like protein (cupin superfamily)
LSLKYTPKNGKFLSHSLQIRNFFIMFIKKVIESPEFIAGDDTLLREILHPENDKLPIGYSIAQARVPVGEASSPHRLKSSETYYILQGEARMYIEDEISELRANQLVFVPAGALQYIENISSQELVFLCIVEPYWKPTDESFL